MRPFPFGATEAFGAVHRATRRSRVARSASRRARDRGRESTTASQRRSHPLRHSAAALRPGPPAAARGTNQARRMFHVKHLFLFPVWRIPPRHAAACKPVPSRSPVRLLGAKRHPCQCCSRRTRVTAARRISRPEHMPCVFPKTWRARHETPFGIGMGAVLRPHRLRPPGRARMFHVKHSFVAWGGGSPRAPPERGAASATRCGPGSLSFGRTSGGRTRLRAYLAPR